MPFRLKFLPNLISPYSRRCFASNDLTDIFVGDRHLIPTGKSDDMLEDQKLSVIGLSPSGFRINDGTFLFGPIAIFPKTVLSWRVLSPDLITPESLELFFLLQPKLDLLVLGVGDRKDLDSVRQRVVKSVREHKIGLEILPTEDAISTYNHLASEDRYVGGAFFPPRELEVTAKQYAEVLEMIRPFDKIDYFSFKDFFLPHEGEEIDNVIKRIWGKERPDIRADLDDVREMNKLAIEKRREKRDTIKKIAESKKKLEDENKQITNK